MKTFDFIRQVLQDTISILYPSLCAACDEFLLQGEDVICTHCMVNLPRTYFHRMPDNPVAKQFWGKVRLEGATALFHFHKGEKVQTLMHRLKYNNRPEIGNKLGAVCATEIMKSDPFNQIDYIIPIPLHKKKQKIRGYNQAYCFAQGMSDIYGKEVLKDGLRRVKFTDTQTRKNRFDRHKNVKMVFRVSKPDRFIGKKVMIVDDVLTTGSTLAACIQLFNNIEGTKVVVATIAYAE
jgi:ComF family protein